VLALAAERAVEQLAVVAGTSAVLVAHRLGIPRCQA
jgi:hypothetical protein